MERKTILVVDDSESIRSAISFLLTFEGHRAMTASGGEEGIRMATEHLPDAILLDLMMPGLDGWATLERLRSDPRTGDIPVIALTALRLTQEQLEEPGFDGYLTKPVAGHRLTEEIDRACSRAG